MSSSVKRRLTGLAAAIGCLVGAPAAPAAALSPSDYLGGSHHDQVTDVATDRAGNVYEAAPPRLRVARRGRRLSGRLRGDGCTARARLLLERRTRARWRIVRRTRTRADGRFKLRLPARPGRYRLRAPCAKARSRLISLR